MKPIRKQLPHDVPDWVPDDSRYFVTINGAERGSDVLCQGGRAEILLASIPVVENLGKWFIHVMMIMPDHLHLIISFGSSVEIRKTIAARKRYHARTHHIDWQYNFFEHRLRNDDAFTEKMHYVLMNPVRKGLVSEWLDWPYCFVRGDW